MVNLKRIVGTALLYSLLNCANTYSLKDYTPPPTKTIKTKKTVSLENKIKKILKKKDNRQVDHFAVILLANPELYHHENVAQAYTTLTKILEYNPENIFILNPSADSPLDLYPSTGTHTIESQYLLMDTLSKVIEPNLDTILIYFTGHVYYEIDGKGGKNAVSKINEKESLTQDEFLKNINNIKPEFGLLVEDKCLWGQPKKISNRWVVITVGTADTVSYGFMFPRKLFEAVDALGEYVSIENAFKYAKLNDPETLNKKNLPQLQFNGVNPSKRTLLGTSLP